MTEAEESPQEDVLPPVFFMLTAAGFYQLIADLPKPPPPIWLNADLVPQADIAELRASGVEITNFVTPVDVRDPASIEGAIKTIAAQHPDKKIWVEHVPELEEQGSVA